MTGRGELIEAWRGCWRDSPIEEITGERGGRIGSGGNRDGVEHGVVHGRLVADHLQIEDETRLG